MTARTHLSIGEVLSLIQEEFPDVTISKIRFLESQGLVDPERTPSGYRKFYDADIERLRWVLRQQRDAFLPLKVIKGRLEGQADLLEGADGQPPPPPPRSFDEDSAATGAGGHTPDAVVGDDWGVASGRQRASAGVVAAPAGQAGYSLDADLGSGATERSGKGPAPESLGEEAPMLRQEGRSQGPRRGTGADQPSRATAQAGADQTNARRHNVASGESAGVPDVAPKGNGATVRDSASTRDGASIRDSAPLRDSASVRHIAAMPESASVRHIAAMPDSAPTRASAPVGESLPVRDRATERVPARRESRSAERGGGPSRPATTAGRAHTTQRSTRGPAAPSGPMAQDEELSFDELVAETGVDPATVHDLERYGLVSARVVAGTAYYNAEAALIATVAAEYAHHGVEARHLRAFKAAAEREAGLVQQVIMPLVRQRNPEARQAAADAIDDLCHLGGELRTVLLRSALSELR